MEVKVMLICILVIHLSSHFANVEGGNRKLSDLEIEKQLKRLNKPSLKTIKTENGDIYDCVDFYKQPAFDNPLLKNHTYHSQMRPTFYTYNSAKRTRTAKNEGQEYVRIGLNDGGCPNGTIPIRRSSKEDVIAAKLFQESFAWNSSLTSPRLDGGRQQYYLYARTRKSSRAKYHGAGGYISIYNPKVDASTNELSSAQITIRNGLDVIKFGWTVNPRLYHDTTTRLFSFFAGNSGSCFNTQCPGFVIVNSQIPLDLALKPISQRGKIGFYAYLFVQQDVSGNWWLQLGVNLDKIYELGFWPRRLFRSGGMVDFATEAYWGGEAIGVFPEMGNGHPPVGDTKFDANFRLVTVMNEARRIVNVDDIEMYSNSHNYKIVDLGVQGKDGHIVNFGGPTFI